ncbi:MAG: S8 family serine peptidase [Candidatus Brocadiae bacterium]|nr:S8 family serine peptidase [Candidatus Brocadiia bacterium]
MQKRKIRTIINRLLQSFILVFLLVACEKKIVVKTPNLYIDPLPGEIEQVQGEDAFSKEQWNLEKISAPKVWDSFMSSKAVTVMLIGSGIDYNHEDLRGNIFVNKKELKEKNPNTGVPYNQKDDDADGLIDNFVGWDFVDNDGLAYDKYGYDTYLAGIIGAVHNNGKGIKGILKKVSLYPVRYINSNGQSRIPTLVRALEHISEVKPDVVLLNLISLQFSRQEAVKNLEKKAIQNALDKAKKLSIPIVIGAGNIQNEFGSKLGIEALFTAYENILVVTSIDKSDQKPFLANYSSRFVHTSAPGEKILTTAPENKYEEISSTHLAAAHIAAAIAYAISEYGREKTYEDYFSALQSEKGSREVENLDKYVAGRNTLDLYKFLMSLK